MAAQNMTARMRKCMEYFQTGTELFNRCEEERPLVNWERKLEQYLELKAAGGVGAKTLTNLSHYLTPFKDWLVDEKVVRPTA